MFEPLQHFLSNFEKYINHLKKLESIRKEKSLWMVDFLRILLF